MNREQYIEMVKTGNFDLNIFYEYYNEFNTNESFKFNINEFQALFNQYISLLGIAGAVNTIREYYDVKFSLVKLLNKDGSLISYY